MDTGVPQGWTQDTSTAGNINTVRKDLSSGVVKLELPVSCLLPVGGSLSAVEGTEAKTERIIEVK